MSIVTICKPFEVTGGADPQSFDISIAINSDSANTTSLTAYYTINGGAQMGAQTFPAFGVVTGQSFTATASGVNTGDIVRICVDADISTSENDTGLVDFSGTVDQTAADACMASHPLSVSCAWTAIGEMIAPDCSAAPASVDCENLPVTFNVPNATAIVSVSPALIDYTASIDSITGDITIAPNVIGSGSGGTHVFTIQGVGVTCQFTLEIIACPAAGISLSGNDCPTFVFGLANQATPQTFGGFFPFTGGLAPFSFVATGLPSGVSVSPSGGGGYSVTIPSNASPTAFLNYSITVTDANNNTATCAGNQFEISGF